MGNLFSCCFFQRESYRIKCTHEQKKDSSKQKKDSSKQKKDSSTKFQEVYSCHTIKVYVITPTGDKIRLYTCSLTNVSEIKMKVAEIIRFHPYNIRIKFDGKELKDERALYSYGITDGSILVCAQIYREKVKEIEKVEETENVEEVKNVVYQYVYAYN